jgi:ferredoxin
MLNGTVGGRQVVPERVTFAHWMDLASTKFDYTPAVQNPPKFTETYGSIHKLTADSAFALYYDMGNAAEESGSTICLYYGVYSNYKADAGDVAVKRAVVACRGTADRIVLQERSGYQGAPSCRSYSTMGHLSDGCTDGCIGYGDCVATCPYGAITLNKNHVAVVDPAVCIGCGLCTTICPRHLISLQEKSDVAEVSFVLCHNTLMGKRAKDACANTCIGCRRCVKVCPQECITVENNVAHIDISKCVGCKVCMGVCPEGAIYPLTWIQKTA